MFLLKTNDLFPLIHLFPLSPNCRCSPCLRWVPRWSWSWRQSTAPECGGLVSPGSVAVERRTMVRAAWLFWPIRATCMWCRCHTSRCRCNTPASARRTSVALRPVSLPSTAKVSQRVRHAFLNTLLHHYKQSHANVNVTAESCTDRVFSFLFFSFFTPGPG